MQYYTAINYGYGFITHEDNQRSYIQGFPGDIWTTENNQIWADRVGAISLTKTEAQIICDAAITPTIKEWETCVSGSTPWLCGPEPQYIILP